MAFFNNKQDYKRWPQPLDKHSLGVYIREWIVFGLIGSAG